ncbi:MAG: thioredoxin-dependent thiol peroxidase [Myxococcota bacterium]|nr:thioredoxin-dependent thiol peroxidase [Myxococcota bacterium]
MLEIGDQAPLFSLPDGDGNAVSLEQFRGQKVFLWFYPKASTPGCTVEGCGLRDDYARFEALGIQVLGMSADTPKRQKNFGTKNEFPFPLVSDESTETIAAYGAWGPKKFMGREYEGIHRISYLIDEAGRIEQTWAKVKTKSHSQDVLEQLAQ